MEFQIMSRAEAEKTNFKEIGEEAIISISTPLEKPKSNFPKLKSDNVLYIECDDVSYHGNIYIIGHSASETEVIYFSDQDAYNILKFLDENLDKENFYIHCDMGRSRSPGVAVGLLKVLGLDFKSFYKKYTPNDYIVNKITDCYSTNYDNFKNIKEFKNGIS